MQPDSQTRVQFGRSDSTHCRQFASDNYAGICPEAWDALEEANRLKGAGSKG